MKPLSTLWPWLLYATALLLAPLLFGSGFAHTLLSQMGIAVIACLSYHLLLGQGGMLSFGHAVYTGAGAYLAMHTLNAAATHGWPLPVSLLPLAAGLGAALIALPLGWVSTRKAGTPFAMITLGVGELAWAVALMFPGVFGGDAGVSGNRVMGAAPWGISFGPAIQLYYLIAVYVLAATLLVHAFTRTTLGTLLNAVRDNPLRVGFLGYDTRTLRLIAFVVAAFLAGISGGLAALQFEIVTPEVLGTTRSGSLLLFTFLGGTTLLAGPVVGGVLMVLALVWLSSLTPAWLLYMGLAFMAVVVFAPDGLAGLAQRAWRARSSPGAFSGRSAGRLLACVLMALGLVMAVEMAYHRQLSATLGHELVRGPLRLDTAATAPWLLALLLGLAGAGLWRLLRGGRHG